VPVSSVMSLLFSTNWRLPTYSIYSLYWPLLCCLFPVSVWPPAVESRIKRHGTKCHPNRRSVCDTPRPRPTSDVPTCLFYNCWVLRSCIFRIIHRFPRVCWKLLSILWETLRWGRWNALLKSWIARSLRWYFCKLPFSLKSYILFFLAL